MFQIIVSFFVVLVCTNNIVHSRNLYFEIRGPRTKTIHSTLDGAVTNLVDIPPSQVAAFEKSLRACLASKNDVLIKKFMVKTLHILNDMTYELAQEAKEKPAKRVNYFFDEDSVEDFKRRDVAKHIDSIVQLGAIFLSILPPDQLKAYNAFTNDLNHASSETKKDFFRIAIKYGNKCAAGIDFNVQKLPSA